MSSSSHFFIHSFWKCCLNVRAGFFFSSKINKSYPRGMGMGMGRRKAGVIVKRRNKMNCKLVEGQVPRGG